VGDPVQRVNGLNLRRVVRMQQGDWEGAERLRRRGEILRLRTRARQMFNTLTVVELMACAMAGDLTGLKQVGERVAALAARAPGWLSMVQLVEGHLHLLCDSFEPALAAFERGIELIGASAASLRAVPVSYCPLLAGQLEAMNGLGRSHDVRALGESALALCGELEIGVAAHGVSRALACAEATTGDGARAARRLDAVIASQLELGITGLHLGASYEARTRVAILAGDADAAQRYTTLTACEYRRGHSSPLRARYERLVRDARSAVKTKLLGLEDIDSSLNSQVTEVTSVSGAQSIASSGATTELDPE
jgi:hypothetical protein